MKKITRIEPTKDYKKSSKLRVAAYCRVSTGSDDQLVSLDVQKSHYEDLICGNPDWEFTGIYYDEGITGTSKEKRPALLRMIADCEEGKIDRIITKSLSRFARNTQDTLELTRKLLDLGITIYFEKENLDTGSMESELLLSIMSSIAESESVSISENVKWSDRRRFEDGTFKISYPAYGFSIKDGNLIINEEEAQWVRWIYAQFLSGKGTPAIAKELNAKQVPSRRKGNWTGTTIKGILTNEKYIGDCLFQKTYSDFRFKRHINRGNRDQFYIEGHHEALISREDFEAVKAFLDQRTSRKKKDVNYQNRYPFTSKLICGECGSTFKRHMNTTGSLRYPVWVCKKHLDDASACSMKFIREINLECAFTTMINKLIFARKEVLEILFSNIQDEFYKENLHQLDKINQEIEKNEENRQNLISIMKYLEPAIYTQESNKVAVEADALNEKKKRLMDEISGNRNKTGELNELIQYLKHAEESADFDGTLVERFLEKATVNTRDEITFHLKCGLNLTELIAK